MRKNFIVFFLLYGSVFAILPEDGQERERQRQEKITLHLAESLYREKKLQHSLIIFRDFIDMYPESKFMVRALETIALVYEELQLYEDALTTYKKLYQLSGISSKGLEYYYHQGRLLYFMGEYDKATVVFENLIRINPDSHYARKARINLELAEILNQE